MSGLEEQIFYFQRLGDQALLDFVLDEPFQVLAVMGDSVNPPLGFHYILLLP